MRQPMPAAGAAAVFCWALAGPLAAQTPPAKPKLDPVRWTLQFEPVSAAPDQKVLGRLTATIEPGWHLYSLSTPKGGPNPTTIALAPSPAVAQATVFEPPAKRAFDPNFQLDTDTYETGAVFLLRVELASGAPPGEVALTAQARYQACTEKICIPPVRRSAAAAVRIDPAARPAAVQIPASYKEAPPPSAVRAAPVPSSGPAREAAAQGVARFVLVALSFGFLAIFTPCVFPMIPITMSYFLGAQAGSRAQSVVQATTFCLGVIVLFTGLGAAVTAILGPFGLTQVGANPWVNLFLALVFLVFGLSLMGAFEITIPSGVLTSVTAASQRGGVAGALIMGLAFALASFACTGPFVGTLLAGSSQGGLYWPILGMLVFATGLASPFFLLALFPAYLARLPKSGGWLERTKVTMSFFILAAVAEYLSKIDRVYQWNLLTRERLLASWIVLLVLAALYLLDVLKLKEAGGGPVGLGRLSAAALLLILAVSLVPGLFGARLGELDAYVPEPAGSAWKAAGGGASELQWIKNNYREALQLARQSGKPVLASFTGYACTNCHWMKTNMFTRPEIAAALDQYVLVELYTDGTDDASEANQRMEETRFGTIAIPFYVILRSDDTVVDTFPGLTRDAGEFERFLKRGAAAS